MKSVCKRSFSSVQVNTQSPDELQKVHYDDNSDADPFFTHEFNLIYNEKL